MTSWTLKLYAALGLVLAQASISQVYRWDAPLLLHGLPVTTIVIVILAWARIERFREDRR